MYNPLNNKPKDFIKSLNGLSASDITSSLKKYNDSDGMLDGIDTLIDESELNGAFLGALAATGIILAYKSIGFGIRYARKHKAKKLFTKEELDELKNSNLHISLKQATYAYVASNRNPDYNFGYSIDELEKYACKIKI